MEVNLLLKTYNAIVSLDDGDVFVFEGADNRHHGLCQRLGRPAVIKDKCSFMRIGVDVDQRFHRLMIEESATVFLIAKCADLVLSRKAGK